MGRMHLSVETKCAYTKTSFLLLALHTPLCTTGMDFHVSVGAHSKGLVQPAAVLHTHGHRHNAYARVA